MFISIAIQFSGSTFTPEGATHFLKSISNTSETNLKGQTVPSLQTLQASAQFYSTSFLFNSQFAIGKQAVISESGSESSVFVGL